MDPEILQALEKLKEVWASGQIEGQPLPQEAVASRMSMPMEQFVQVVMQDKQLSGLFAEMQQSATPAGPGQMPPSAGMPGQ